MRSHRRSRPTTWLPITLVLYYWLKAVPVVLALQMNFTLDWSPFSDLLLDHDHSDPSTGSYHFSSDACWRYFQGRGIWERVDSNEEEPPIFSSLRSSSLSHVSPHPLTVQAKRRRSVGISSLKQDGDDWPAPQPSLCFYDAGSEVRIRFRFTGSGVYLFSRNPSHSTWKISIDGSLIPISTLLPSSPPPPPWLILAQTNLVESPHTLEIAYSPSQTTEESDKSGFSNPFSHIVYTKHVDQNGQSPHRKFRNDDDDSSNSGSVFEGQEEIETKDEKDLDSDSDSDSAGAAENQPRVRMIMMKRKGTRNMRRQENPVPTPTPIQNTSPPVTTPTSSAPATTTSNAATKKRNVATFAAAVGGSVGVLALFSAGLALSIIRRRYRAKKRERLARQSVTSTAQFPPMMTQTGGGAGGAVISGATGIGVGVGVRGEGVWGPVGSGFTPGQGPGGTRAGSSGGSRTSGSGSDGFVPRFFPSEVPAAPPPPSGERSRGLLRHLMNLGGRRRRGSGNEAVDHLRSTDTDATMTDVDPPGYNEVIGSSAPSSPLTPTRAAVMHPVSLPLPPQVPLPSGPPPGYDPSVQMIQHYPYIHRQPPRPPSVASSIGAPGAQESGVTGREAASGTRREGVDMSYADIPPAEDPPPEVQALFPTRSAGSERAAGTVRRREDQDRREPSGEDEEGSCPATPPGVPVPLTPLPPVSQAAEHRTSVSPRSMSMGLGPSTTSGPRGGDDSQFR